MRRLALLAAVFATCAAHAAPVTLGLDASLNLLAFGNMNVSSSDVEGRVAVGGNANISGYSINTKTGSSALYAGTGLTVGGNLTFTSGSIWGGVQVGGSYTPSQSGTVKGGVQSGTGIDFAAERARLSQLSQAWDAMANTGSAYDQWGTLHFNASGQSLAVFDVQASDLLKNMQIDGLAAGSQVLINVHGSMVDFGNHGYTGFEKGQVIFNLVDAVSVLLNGGINASLLALDATVNPGWGQINGQVVVNNWNTSMQVNDAPIPGTTSVRPQTPTAQALPEPGSVALVGLGLAALLAAGRRARR
ncbi:choice-of-anchor A family protein [Roseateles sp.]|uniref:choice-of-anchor A family protein n=1 Tax=Roseateles sp. TaxID=1971397 RepID=UPI0025D74539|nr:choice-of-anchor A family protein [Roseateles sp.]MBV8033869.1 choice-of-anchor A family protein [Roseateles sp.]